MGQVVSQRAILVRRGEWKRTGQVVVCAEGCVDLLHPGHIRLLEQARAHGDVLVVAVQSDVSAQATPGGAAPSHQEPRTFTPPRPITPAAERSEILAALASVDYVAVFDDASPREFLARLRPDEFVRGAAADFRDAASRGDAEIEALGCKVSRIPLEPGYSTARSIERIAELPS